MYRERLHLPFERLFLVETSSFSAHFCFRIPKYVNTVTVNNYINIYIFFAP